MMDVREALAGLMHEIWAVWANHMLAHMTEDNVSRWIRQINTQYQDLSEDEKESDRHQAERILRFLQSITS